MKTAKKAMLMTLCAIILVVATVFGTMAYLTSTDEVNNTFTVGNVKITLDEAKVDTALRAQPVSIKTSTSSCPAIHTPKTRPSMWMLQAKTASSAPRSR